MTDPALEKAFVQVSVARSGVPVVKAFFDAPTFTFTSVVHDAETRLPAVIDSVLTYDPAAGRTGHEAVEPVIARTSSGGNIGQHAVDHRPPAGFGLLHPTG